MAPQNGLSPTDTEDIPSLESISPAIFVATDRDFTKTPPPLSDDPVTRMEETIEALDWHAARVEENMIAMMVREAERVRRAGQVERVQYDVYGRPMKTKDHERAMSADELRLEEVILRQDKDVVRKILIDGKHRDNSRDAVPSPRPRGPRGPEYADLETIRKEKMCHQVVEPYRQTPRSEALTSIFNLVKWGWNEQLEGHGNAIKLEKEERRANFHRQMKENPFMFATTGRLAPAPSAATAALPHKNLPDGDPMDIDEP
ncbi:hypothetical protein F5B17DRAFT_270320 [Nemania serpens]|nr:hypothetical protein F5B17DRAFT_270320 [Nemania serpens]